MAGRIARRVLCIRRLPHVSPEEFRRHWREEHASLVRKHAELLGTLRYVQLDPAASGARDARASGEQFDGIAEFWLDLDRREASASSPEGQRAMEELRDDGAQFIDHSRSIYMYVDEGLVFDAEDPASKAAS